MAEQWEFLEFNGANVLTYTPTGYKLEKIKDFLRDRGKKGDNFNDAFTFILAEGWEPLCFAGSEYATYKTYTFKRPKV